ncbi:immunoglobulin E-set domain-containing protein [Dictyostelium discoideum AX4]|uniref:Immunoglobulin E-set domain-containing protein n=1 Tax=Dictyostelium discoideum TaxID=44689 RepID=Q54YI5_DICDI|nr:immunoglobulin E-set domain-containing protein [Dictyostelium discoideum AX4]EAL68532.1 immunoglobulin E-set domain-containing protein [Dictyostelium discoideum AX4]|eukprot:XP_642217.1 immunoglobulin E-set domain-containing protein [Dictyostelium discoideum AX4]
MNNLKYFIIFLIFIFINIIKCELIDYIPIIKEFQINKEYIKIKTDINNAYYSNWTLYSDIEFSKPTITIGFDCKIVNDIYRECTFESSKYKNQLNAHSIDACLVTNQINNQGSSSKCGIILIESVHPYPIISNLILTNDGILKLNGYYLNFDTNFILWTGNNTDEILILNSNTLINENEINFKIPKSTINLLTNTQLYLVINWNYNKSLPINLILNNNNNNNKKQNDKLININNNNNNNNIEILSLNKELSSLLIKNGKLIINGNNLKGNFSVQVGEKYCSNVRILNSNLIEATLPDGVHDGKLIPVKVYLNNILINSVENKLQFSYQLPDIKSIKGLSRDGGVITIYGLHFNLDIIVLIGDEQCSSSIINFKKVSYDTIGIINNNNNNNNNKNNNNDNNNDNSNKILFDELTCYIGPIHNETLEYTFVKLMNNKGYIYIEKKIFYQKSINQLIENHNHRNSIQNEINPNQKEEDFTKFTNSVNNQVDKEYPITSAMSAFYTLTNISVLVFIISLFIILLKRKSIIPKLYNKNK